MNKNVINFEDAKKNKFEKDGIVAIAYMKDLVCKKDNIIEEVKGIIKKYKLQTIFNMNEENENIIIDKIATFVTLVNSTTDIYLTAENIILYNIANIQMVIEK